MLLSGEMLLFYCFSTFQFCGHVMYDSKVLEDMRPDAVYITSVRDPATQVPSAFRFYYPNDHDWDIDRVLNLTWVKIGMNTIYVPPKYLTSSSLLDRFIKEDLDSLFELVLVKEYFDESLVLLRRKLCWDLEDIIYFPLKVASNKTQNLDINSDKIRAKMVG